VLLTPSSECCDAVLRSAQREDDAPAAVEAPADDHDEEAMVDAAEADNGEEPAAPLSFSKFAELPISDKLKQRIADSFKFETMTEIQVSVSMSVRAFVTTLAAKMHSAAPGWQECAGRGKDRLGQDVGVSGALH
jgi:hypothetical protein